MAGIEGKVVIITGAGSGMGEADAVLLAQRGARVVLGDLRQDRLEAVAARIAGDGGVVSIVQTDVRRREDVERLVTSACERYGRLDVLVNNAGVMPISPPTTCASTSGTFDVRAQLDASRDAFAMSPEVVANAIEQPDDVDVGEIVIRSTAQG